MRELWLVRHGETEWSKSGQHTGRTDIPLTEAGREQASLLRQRLTATSFDLVLTSPLQRASTTAELAGFSNAEPCDDLLEWDYGPGEGLTSDQIRERVTDWRIWTHGAPQFVDERAGETKAQVQARLRRVVERVRAADGERALVFAHGHSLRVLATDWCGFPIEAGAHFPLQTATVSVLGYEKTTPAIVRWNA